MGRQEKANGKEETVKERQDELIFFSSPKEVEDQDQDSTGECKRAGSILTAGEKYKPVWRATCQL